MYLNSTKSQFHTVYGAGRGNAPALSYCSVGHLRAVFSFILKAIRHANRKHRRRSDTGTRIY